MMRFTDRVAGALVVIGALSWGLVGLAELDLLATLTGQSFGETSLVTRTLYGLIGVSGVWWVVRFLRTRAGRQGQAVGSGSPESQKVGLERSR